ncbi:protein DPCD [Lingula anatina]|uniref:Protein DPCD n=1 Tax=Lingula anatina TaxID=7574 RepID=A0A1S3IIS4_LINAN|nr:protein DPCD [Lingula anatina]|eukprot:XP_013397786.1 protein DPCD [Lingula anatina]
MCEDTINNMASKWVETLREAEKTSIIQDGRRKIHFTLKDGTELAEEYDTRNNELVVRKWRKKSTLGSQGKWDFEVGEQLAPRNLDAEGLMESTSNPIFVRTDTKKAFQWRIRNLPYPIETYDVRVDAENRCVIIRTTNKKYYKKFTIPDMDRAALPLSQSSLSVAYANNTLILNYEKPKEILAQEKILQEEFKKMKAAKDGDVECNPS